MSYFGYFRCLLTAILLLASGIVYSQIPPTLYDGPDRTQKLVEGARAEGSLLLYTSMAEKDVQALVKAFEEKYGINVEVFRSGKNKVLQRVLTEASAGRYVVDVVHNPSPEMEALHREKMLQRVKSPFQKNLIPAALPAHGEWTGMRVYVFVQAYNTDKVKPSELPRTYQDLLDPRWKGRLGIEAKEQEWFMTLVQSMGEKKGLDYFHKLVATNGLSVRSGNSLLVNLVMAGEVPFALTTYSYLDERGKAKGAPIDYIALKPTIAYTDGIGIAKKAPHPNAATLFYDFILSDGQKMMAKSHQITSDKQDASKFEQFSPIYIDPVAVLDNYEKWGKIYDDVLNGRAVP